MLAQFALLLRNARAKVKRLGGPRVSLDHSRVAALRTQGLGWKQIAAVLQVGVGTLCRLMKDGSTCPEGRGATRHTRC